MLKKSKKIVFKQSCSKLSKDWLVLFNHLTYLKVIMKYKS